MKKNVWLLLVLLLSFNLFSQSRKADSLSNLLIKHPKEDTTRVNLLNEVSLLIFKNQPEKSFQYATEALTLSRNLFFLKGELQAKNNLAVYYLMKGASETALESAIEATQLGERIH